MKSFIAFRVILLLCFSAFMRENASFIYKGKEIALNNFAKNTDTIEKILSEMIK